MTDWGEVPAIISIEMTNVCFDALCAILYRFLQYRAIYWVARVSLEPYFRIQINSSICFDILQTKNKDKSYCKRLKWESNHVFNVAIIVGV